MEMLKMRDSIIGLGAMVDELPEKERGLFRDMFMVSASMGRLHVPESFRERCLGYFHDPGKGPDETIRGLEEQKIVSTYNLWTGEGAIFNELRSGRPGMRDEERERQKERLLDYIKGTEDNCDFCSPCLHTPVDVFSGGRVTGKHCVTGSNIAKYDAWNGMVYFGRHNPLDFDGEELSDYLETAFRWLRRVHEHDNGLEYPLIVWNCLEKAGASQVHGHAQALVRRDRPYSKALKLRRDSQGYERERHRDYFQDLFSVHESIGLGLRNRDSRTLVCITPGKEKETIVMAPYKGPDNTDSRDDLRDSMYRVLRCFIDNLGVHSFNLVIYMPPMKDSDYDFPYFARIVDRGSIFKKTADIGVMEMYGEPVIGSDPYRVMEALRSSWQTD